MSEYAYILDSRLSNKRLSDEDRSLRPYELHQGIYLRVYGRGDLGESVVCERRVEEGLAIRLSDDKDEMTDAAERKTYQRQLVKRLTSSHAAEFKWDLCQFKFEWSTLPSFYGLELDDDGSRLEHWTLTVRAFSLQGYRALKRLAKAALHDGEHVETFAPLRPCALCGAEQAEALEHCGLAHGQWTHYSKLHTFTTFTPAPLELQSTLPNLLLASYDIECSSGQRKGSANQFPFPDATKPDHQVRSIALVLKTLYDDFASTMRRFFLHTGPAALTNDHIAVVAPQEDASETAEHLTIHCYRSEVEMLRGFAKLLVQFKPDILYSYNGNGFDAPFLRARINLHFPVDASSTFLQKADRREAYAWGRSWAGEPRPIGPTLTEEEQAKRAADRRADKVIYDPCTFDSPGLAHHDVMEFGKSLNLESAKLNDVAEHVLGSQKTDMPVQELFRIMANKDVGEWARVAVYNLRDAELPLDIMLRRRQAHFALQIAAVSNCTLAEVCAGGQQKRLLSMVMKEVRDRRMVFNEPSRRDFISRPWLFGGGEKVKGATVLDIRPGWYRDPVVTTDYNSLYPSILISRNLCPSKLLLDEVKSELSDAIPATRRQQLRRFEVEEIDDEVVHYHYVEQRDPETGEGDGVLPSIARRLLEERKDAKLQMKQHQPGMNEYTVLDAKQSALKVIANSLYGGLNAIMKGSLYCRPLGSIVTAEGRLAIERIRNAVKRVPNSEIVAGDTDSVMFLLKGRTLVEARSIGEVVAKEVTLELHADGAMAMKLAYEKTMLPSVFVAKKAYAYMCHTEPGKQPTYVSMGLLSKKRGTCSLLKDAFIDCEQAYLLDPSAFSAEEVRLIQLAILRDMCRRLADPNPEAFAKTMLLRTEESYTANYNAAHVNAARRLVRDTGCAWPAYERLKFVQVQPPRSLLKSKYKVSDYSMCFSQFITCTSHQVDVAHYVGNVRNRFEALLMLSLPDVVARFDRLMVQLAQQPAVASTWKFVTDSAPIILPPMLPLRIERLSGNASSFWKARLVLEADVAAAPKTSALPLLLHSFVSKPMGTSATTSTLQASISRSIAATQLIDGVQKAIPTQDLVRLALRVTMEGDRAHDRDDELHATLKSVTDTDAFEHAKLEHAAQKAIASEQRIMGKKAKLEARASDVANAPSRSQQAAKAKKRKGDASGPGSNLMLSWLIKKPTP